MMELVRQPVPETDDFDEGLRLAKADGGLNFVRRSDHMLVAAFATAAVTTAFRHERVLRRTAAVAVHA